MFLKDLLVFLKKDFMYMCVSMWTHAHEYRYPQRPEEGVGSSGAGVTELLNLRAGN